MDLLSLEVGCKSCKWLGYEPTYKVYFVTSSRTPYYLRFFQHTFGTHPKQPLPTGYNGSPFIVGQKDGLGCAISGCVVIFLDARFKEGHCNPRDPITIWKGSYTPILTGLTITMVINHLRSPGMTLQVLAKFTYLEHLMPCRSHYARFLRRHSNSNDEASGAPGKPPGMVLNPCK